jgi:hypothetical protein
MAQQAAASAVTIVAAKDDRLGKREQDAQVQSGHPKEAD